MKTGGGLCAIILISVLAFASTCSAGVQAQTGDLKNFLDSGFAGLRVQVNATAEAQPEEDIAVILALVAQTNVTVEYFNLNIYGFLNGTDELLMANISDSNLQLNSETKMYSLTFEVPEQVWAVTYGEISLNYTADFGVFKLSFPNLVDGFTMTNVKNVYFENLEKDFSDLSEGYRQLNATFWQLFQNYTSAQASLSELEGTRTAIVVVAVAAVFFAMTTVYLLMRRPRQCW